MSASQARQGHGPRQQRRTLVESAADQQPDTGIVFTGMDTQNMCE
jgi:hypothetical protein